MKISQPLIITARITEHDLEYFDNLRKAYFPRDRNVLRAHLTMFHHLPGEYERQAEEILLSKTNEVGPFAAEVCGLRHLGGGVAFQVSGGNLIDLRDRLRVAFLPWLKAQDLQKWQPHITVQNKVPKAAADALFSSLSKEFRPRQLVIAGLDLWRYLDGPWEHLEFFALRESCEAVRG